jgi:hypothetical protein
VANATLRAELLAAYAAAKQMPESYFNGPLPGTLYYGYEPSTRTYWALARFSLTPAASLQAGVDMQDGGDTEVFMRPSGHSWKGTIVDIPGPCPGTLPAAVMTLWGLVPSGACVVVDASSPARATLANPLPVPNLPAGLYFGTILNVELELDGSGSILFEPETWQGASAPVSHSGHTVFLTLGPSTTTGYWVGNTASSSHEVTGHFDKTFARLVEEDMAPFTTQPYAGYVIDVAIPAGCTGACGEAASVTQFSSLTPTPANPDYTEPPS